MITNKISRFLTNFLIIEESFKRLQSGESNSLEEMVNQCCKREPHFKIIGYGMRNAYLFSVIKNQAKVIILT
jgi:hypothetical protein